MQFSKQEAILKELFEDDYFTQIITHPSVQSPYEELTCAICYNLFDIPIILPDCKHTFCRDCLDQWVSKQAMNCPLCRIDVSHYLTNKQLKFSLIDFNTMFLIDNIEVKCPNCNWKGKTKDLKLHQQKYCNLMSCPLNCNLKFTSQELEFHKDICKYRIIKCPQYCGEEFEAHKIFNHLQNCMYTYKECNKCNCILQGIKMLNHNCNIDSCRNSQFGCKKQELHTNCDFEFNYCKNCYDFLMNKDLQTHTCQIQNTIQEVLKSYQNQLLESLQPVKHDLKLLENAMKKCQQESILLLDVPADKVNIVEILQQFGPIQNMKQYLNFPNLDQKKVAVRYFNVNSALCCKKYIKIFGITTQSLEIGQKQIKQLPKQKIS
ncbi:unnamed protein product [Paramecium primaurelia]|uniref:RING-type domain-containing protein n=1 Tax=Paramecium primaurelia TaxID=5886 RepID=A0A8S1ME66_PARPR|nr:unnamed protein product [Paramecium primaurelia]